MKEVIFSKSHNGIATITLNRPHALNALTFNMVKLIKEQLEKWEKDAEVTVVILEGAGDRAFCAGGDIKAVYGLKDDKLTNQNVKYFFEEEYKLDLYIYNYLKPIIANMNGIIMGGGVGLANGASHRIVTDKTVWAMPEMSIGFFTDVGAGHFFNKAPGYVGRYLALTANSIKGADVIYINAADAYMSSEKLEQFLNDVRKINWLNEQVPEKLNELVSNYDERSTVTGVLKEATDKINEHFKYETVEQIIDSLDGDSSDFATRTRYTMLSKSPFSLKVTLKQQIECENKSMEECLEIDTILASHFMNHNDFFEGIRSVLIDRDNDPQYEYKTLADVTSEVVDAFFQE